MSLEQLRIRANRLRREIEEEQRRLLEKSQNASRIEQQINFAENGARLARRTGNYVLEQQYLSQIPELRRKLIWLRQEMAREQARLDQLINQLRMIEEYMSRAAGRVYKRGTY